MAYVRILLSVIIGLFVGSLVNMGLIKLGGQVIPLPPGADVTTSEGLKASLHLFQTRHFLFPFLAHALGTMVGAYIATRISRTSGWIPAMTVGAFFFLGGVISARMLPAPTWFIAADLILAYFPLAWFGWQLARTKQPALPETASAP